MKNALEHDGTDLIYIASERILDFSEKAVMLNYNEEPIVYPKSMLFTTISENKKQLIAYSIEQAKRSLEFTRENFTDSFLRAKAYDLIDNNKTL